MKFHPTVVSRILYLCQNYGGHLDNKKLIGHLNELKVTPYFQSNGGNVLVETKILLEEMKARNMPTKDVMPLSLHGEVVQKIIDMTVTFSGYTNDKKLATWLTNLDLTPYERKINKTEPGIVVLTSSYLAKLKISNK